MREPVLDAAALQEILTAAFPGAEIPVVESVDAHHVSVALPVGPHHVRPGGTLSGPAMMMLADTAAWCAVMSQVGPVVLAVTTSLHIDFLRRPPLDDVVARTHLLKLGRRLAVIEVAITSRATDELVAKAQVTYSIPPGASLA